MLALVVGWVCLATAGPAERAECRGDGRTGPRTLVLALDGVPYRVVARARATGAFEGWPETGRLIAPFPSVTNVSFTEMLQPAGLGPAPGYEYSYFDRGLNHRVNNSPFHYRQRSFAWRDEFDAIGRSLGSKLAVYTRPRKKAIKELDLAEHALMSSTDDLVLAHIGSTDALQHIHGDEATLKLLLQIEKWLPGLRRRHLEQTGRPLRIVLLSDHGNTDGKVTGAGGFKRRLRKAGFEISDRLEHENDVVATTFGIVGYGALFLDPAKAGIAAEAIAGHDAVAFSVWVSGPGELSVVSHAGKATVEWRGVGEGREYAYRAASGDPLDLEPARLALDRSGALDDEGFALDEDWLRATASSDNPDALHRLVESLTGSHLVNHANVLFSMLPGRSWGMKAAKAGSWIRAGHLEGTHGALDRESSIGFVLAEDERSMPPGGVVRAGSALDRYFEQAHALAGCGSDEQTVAGAHRFSAAP